MQSGVPIQQVQTNRATIAPTHLTTPFQLTSIRASAHTTSQQRIPAEAAQRSAWVYLTPDPRLSAVNSATAGNPAAEHLGPQWQAETDRTLAAVIARAERQGHIVILASMGITLPTAPPLPIPTSTQFLQLPPPSQRLQPL